MKKRIKLPFLLVLTLAVCVMFLSINGKVHAASGPIDIGFKPNDTVLDPVKPIVYMTKLGSDTLYSVNFDTGEIKTLQLPYPAERLAYYDNKLYVTQLYQSHSDQVFNGSGSIAEINLSDFTINRLIQVNIDPYDIAIDQDGYMYIAPGSGQFGDLMVYSLKENSSINQESQYSNISAPSEILYDQQFNKIYALDLMGSPHSISVLEIRNHQVIDAYEPDVLGKFNQNTLGRITPDGLYLYSKNGMELELSAVQSGDTQLHFDLEKNYNDYAFDLTDQLTFAANSNGGVDVYKYNSDQYLRSLLPNMKVDTLLYQNGLIVFYNVGNYHEYLEKINNIKDTELPSITLKYNKAAHINKNIYVTITVADNDGIESLSLPDGSIITYTHLVKNSQTTYVVKKNGLYKLTVKDIDGNIQTKYLTIHSIDRIAPSLYLEPSQTKATHQNITISAEGWDEVGVKFIRLPNKTMVNASKTNYTVHKNGTYVFQVGDFAGNVTTQSIKITGIDKTPPRVPSINKVTSKTKTVAGTSEKYSKVYVYYEGSIINHATTDKTGHVSISLKGRHLKKGHYIKCYAVDQAGNRSKTVTLKVY